MSERDYTEDDGRQDAGRKEAGRQEAGRRLAGEADEDVQAHVKEFGRKEYGGEPEERERKESGL